MFGILRRVYRWFVPKKADTTAFFESYLLSVLHNELNQARINGRKKQDARNRRARALLEGKR